MGAWGVGLFDDDMALDVSGDFHLVGDGASLEDATARLSQIHGDDPTFSVVLALVQCGPVDGWRAPVTGSAGADEA